MSVLYLALPIALLLAAGAIAAFIWSVRQGQYDDLDTPAVRMLFDDEENRVKNQSPSNDRTNKETPNPDTNS